MVNGEALRDVALDRLAISNTEWVSRVIRAIASLAIGHEFTTDALWRMVPELHEPRAMGAAIAMARRLGFIEPAGRYERSERSKCHARPVAVWRRC